MNVLITGGASGLGAAVARRVAEDGGRPLVLDRHPPKDDVEHMQADLADRRCAERAVHGLARAAGGLNAVVTAAGIDACGTLCDVPAEDWERVVQVNLLGTAAVVRAALPYLENEPHGRVVTVASTLGFRAVSDATAYCASKFGVVGFTRALAAEMARPGRRDHGRARRHGHRVLRRPRRPVQAGTGRQAEPPGGRRGDRRVRALPAGRLRGARAGRVPLRRAVVAVEGLGAADRALVLRALGLGDLLTAVPALRALRRGMPRARIALAAPAALAPLARATGAVDGVLPASGLDAPPRPAGPVDVAVNLHGSGPRSHRLLAGLSPGRLLAFACRPSHPGGPEWDPAEHEVDRWCRLVAAYGFDADPGDLDLPVPAVPSPAPGAAVVHPGAAFPARRWPAERFAAVAAALRDGGERVVVTGGPGEAHLARRVVRLAGLDGAADLAGRTPLPELAALVAGARLVVCGDTGVAHLATAFRTPSVLLFGPTPPGRWGPPDRAEHHVLWTGRRGDPHGREPCPGLLEIPADRVVEAAGEALAHQNR
ncbi:SDR family NAD(P)-dependent oxidoreductase [Actinomadura madurae]|uniref:SDR family NAD(P)-dependent oxidoreductase n=1 Tax=Actinomadura madurae TaxID=1993 RepID=UPI0020D20C10|nr:SDR family NAD(P)-dependent oxidoreductase [Actinomadura madurae]MCP9947464.1 SDR family NAD(P)-dependent oxidoreductase [Actinomadura madurae]